MMNRALLLFVAWLTTAFNVTGVAAPPQVVAIVNDNSYRPTKTLPRLLQDWRDALGYRTTLLNCIPGQGIERVDEVATADLIVLFVRREPLPQAHYDALQAHVKAGKPVLALRTASHAFALSQGKPATGLAVWPQFDKEILGGNYHGHFDAKLGGLIEPMIDAKKHPILAGVEPWPLKVTGELYRTHPTADDATVLLKGSVPGQVQEPCTWFRFVGRAPVFYTSLGTPEHFALPQFRRLLTNAAQWLLSKPEPVIGKPFKAAALRDSGTALPPAEALQALTTLPGLAIDQVLTEPTVAQPVFLNFDERGRMWVVQYLQYPFPAGLKILGEDKYLRATYDKVPPAPPNHFRGADKITIHEDTDGDGKYDKQKTFVEGLSITSAVERGRGGVWMLNPPYLLFYPDRNNDDVPDGDPEVHLSGFGLEDTHSVVNSLQWGPDGWLYAAQGSTVSGDVIRPGLDKTPVHTLGQVIWRYHPETRRYEVFAEGGGNAFGVEIDSQGRIYSGHNGGDTRGFHYVQGGYYQKGFAKHGALSNPFTFGYFPAMKHAKVQRFTHCSIVYEGGALPAQFTGKMFGVHPILNHVVYCQLDRDGSSFKTVDLGMAIESSDGWFRPVDIKVGPDGAIYVADFYEGQIAHLMHHDGKIDRESGRIYRLRDAQAKPLPTRNLATLSSRELVQLLASSNKWQRRTALRLLGDRRDASLVPELTAELAKASGQTALETLWALNVSGGFNPVVAADALRHSNPSVRLWTVRLLGDDRRALSTGLAQQLAELAKSEPDVDVRSQLACTARRLPAEQGLPIVAQLAARAEDVDDIHLPLLAWWAIEAQIDTDRSAVVNLWRDARIWDEPLVKKHLLSRLMRRFAQAGSRKDLATCAELIRLAPHDDARKQLLRGFEEAYQGRSMTNLPDELAAAMERLGGQSLSLALRRGSSDSVDRALALLADPKADVQERLQIVQILGEVRQPRCVPGLLRLATDAPDEGTKMAALTSLAAYDAPETSAQVLAAYSSYTDDVRAVAQSLLVSRKAWARDLVAAVERGQIDRAAISADAVRQLTFHRDDQLAAAVKRVWGSIAGSTTADMRAEIERLQAVIAAGSGSPYAGKKLFAASCAKCHRLFDQGGQIGPDLTSFKRNDLAVMLANIVNPSAEIREGFETYTATTNEGRVVTGFLVERDNQVVVIRGADGQTVSLAHSDLDELTRQPFSIMPEGQLKALSDEQLRDLFAYLRSTQPLSD